MLDLQAPSNLNGAKHFQILHYKESLELTLQNFSFYFQTSWPSWSVLANGNHSSILGKISAFITIKKDWEKRVLGDISDGEPRRSSWEFEIGDKELFWQTIFWTKHFGSDFYLGLYAGNYEPFTNISEYSFFPIFFIVIEVLICPGIQECFPIFRTDQLG